MRKAVVPFVLSVGLIAVWAAPADAASTRAEYVAQAEAVCAAPAPQLIKLIQQEKQLHKRAGDLTSSQLAVKLGKILGKLSTIEGRILTQLATIPPAPGDEAVIAQWLQGERDSQAPLNRAARAGKHGKLGQMLALLKQSISVSTQANQLVADFGFQTCVF
ncbi:MAG TPA: hypothetical protein VGJ61_06775 [Solirubrobacterales bacterium]